MAGDAIHVEGLAELRKTLGQIDKELPKRLRVKLRKVGEKVAADARADVPVKSGRARASIKAGASGNTAYVQGGRKTVAYFGWLEYGGVLKPTGARRNTIKRERKPAGRFLYPAIKRNSEHITREATAAFAETARELGLT